jgi:MFS family permease
MGQAVEEHVRSCFRSAPSRDQSRPGTVRKTACWIGAVRRRYLTAVLKVNYVTVFIIMMIALTLGAPFFVAFGALSERIGRRNIMTLGFALAVVTFWPVFTWLGTFKDDPVMLTILVFYLVILFTMVYGPIAAFLVELFPARIRYASMSLPYHVGNGVFGGLVPAAGASIAAITGIALSGLLYPMATAAIGVVVSLAFIREPTHRVRIWDEVGGGAPPLVPDEP